MPREYLTPHVVSLQEECEIVSRRGAAWDVFPLKIENQVKSRRVRRNQPDDCFVRKVFALGVI